jgi:hypothetical protein
VQGVGVAKLKLTVPEGSEPGTYSSTLHVSTVDEEESSAGAMSDGTLQIPMNITVAPEQTTLGLLSLGAAMPAPRRRR